MSEQENVTGTAQAVTSLETNVPNLAKYMNFVGLLQIIVGVLYCLMIIGALIGVPMIFMGIRLREAADGFKKYLASGSKEDLTYTIDRQTRSFFIQFVLAIIGLIFIGIYLIVIIGLLAAGSLF